MSSIIETAFNVFKSFMKKKLQERIFIHGSDYTKLYEHVPKELLPSDYGGDLPSADEISRKFNFKILLN